MAPASPACEAGAPEPRVSSHSLWTDRRWRLDGKRPGLPQNLLTIDWDVEFADGSRLTDPRWTGLLEAARRFLWSLKVDPPPGRGWARNSSLGSAHRPLRILLRWMIEHGIRRFADLDRDAAEHFLSTIAARSGRNGRPLSAATLHHHANLLAVLYAQREKLPDAPSEHPFGGERAAAVTALANHVSRPMPYRRQPPAGKAGHGIFAPRRALPGRDQESQKRARRNGDRLRARQEPSRKMLSLSNGNCSFR